MLRTRGGATLPRCMRVTYDVEAALGKLKRADRRLGSLIKRVAKAGLAAELTPAEEFCPCASLARSIMYQQLSGKAAATIHGRVLARLPGGVVTAEGLLGLSIDDLRSCGVSQNKAVALHDLAHKTSAGVVPPFAVLAGLPALPRGAPDMEAGMRAGNGGILGRFPSRLLGRLRRRASLPHRACPSR